ncbi:MAG: ABC transporter substrate-binding protein [Methylococcales bacterium]|nr:ABC transporter substrate-binding protein [Methylococcales bacterium]
MSLIKNRKLITGLFVFFLGFNASVYAEKTSKIDSAVNTEKALEAKDVVLLFQDTLLGVMKKGAELGFKGRYQALEPAIVKSHDLAKVARIVVGKEWKSFSQEQKQKLNEVFSRLSIASYAHNFKGFSGESFEYLSEDETARGGRIIHSVFVLPEDKNVKFDYMLKKKAGNWLIINVIANGVSDLALKRSEYTSILKREGFEALIAKISEKIDNYTNQ